MAISSEPADLPGLVVTSLTKHYGSKRVVDAVSFHCRPGTVTGFIGPNGSGKSTTLRMIVGHSMPTAGRALFDGKPFSGLNRPGRTVGLLLDASAQHPGRTVFETARLAGLLIGVSRNRVADCLSAVGLASVFRRRVASLSLGMRQRLGLAVALLGSPDYLILDEPANGLDPEGIHWLRDFLRGFAAVGGTVLASSHQLAEIEAAADEILVIDRGKAFVGQAPGSPGTTLKVASDDNAALQNALAAAGIASYLHPDGDHIVASASGRDVGLVAKDSEGVLSFLAPNVESLEERFMKSTSGEFAGLRGDQLVDFARTKER